MLRRLSPFFLLLFLLPLVAGAQKAQPDSVSSINKKANRAALMSAILPGAGQAYNKSYWKIPVLYAGVGALIYFVKENDTEYDRYKEVYSYRLDGDSTTNDTEFANLNNEDIKVRMDYYRRNRDLCYVLLGAVYVLNIIDAYVDAHMKEFDVSDNLSLRARPFFFLGAPGQPAGGISLCIKLKK